MAERNQVVFLLDVDNTLLDDDRVTADLKTTTTRPRGSARPGEGRNHEGDTTASRRGLEPLAR